MSAEMVALCLLMRQRHSETWKDKQLACMRVAVGPDGWLCRYSRVEQCHSQCNGTLRDSELAGCHGEEKYESQQKCHDRPFVNHETPARPNAET